ncbi:hypothetical protein [Ferrimonas aestuarii]|uniref:Restriction alleviation protein, Lar family n=1 Tax=Ferrimonas aestuarii TaxID=2569539 RepID=A0A4U1BSL1_9GAMM|nr:hypothetical protein [Ferrimonas aestuarii]TKB56520.1 hypothetical protein FCL42_05145 [Ferrimonas aestuarii]
MKATSSVLPCPFCGGLILSQAVLYSSWGDGHEAQLHIVCDDCEAAAPHSVWNHRVDDTALGVKPKRQTTAALIRRQ